MLVALGLFSRRMRQQVVQLQAVARQHGTGSRQPSQPDLDANNFKVDHPEQFPLATAGEHVAAPELNVTGVVSPDVSRQVPVPSLATGRIVGNRRAAGR